MKTIELWFGDNRTPILWEPRAVYRNESLNTFYFVTFEEVVNFTYFAHEPADFHVGWKSKTKRGTLQPFQFVVAFQGMRFFASKSKDSLTEWLIQ